MTDFTKQRTTMVDTQIRPSDVTKYSVIEAMLAVPREAFVPAEMRSAAYTGGDVQLERGRVVMEPRTLAKLLDSLNIQADEMVLHVGCGLGYGTAIMARMAEFVVALEEDHTLAAEAEVALSEHGVDNVTVVQAPLAGGVAKHGPYDVIFIEGAVEQFPKALESQLKEGGRVACIFVENNLGTARVGLKRNGQISWRFLFNAGAPLLPGFAAEPSFVL